MYRTRNTIVLFHYGNSEISTFILRKPVSPVLKQSLMHRSSMRRPGFSTLSEKTKLSVLRQVLKSIHNNPSSVLEQHLSIKRL